MATLRTATLALALATAAVAATPARVQTSVGIVTAYAPAQKSFSLHSDAGESLRFQWDAQTKFNGVVFKGAKVSVRYTGAPDGPLAAQTVGVVK